MIWLSAHIKAEAADALLPPGVGWMLTPLKWNLPTGGRPWAADNGCFARPERYTDAGYLAWLEGADLAPHRGRCLFATAPDVVGDWEATWARSRPLLPRLREAGYKAALVAQDGMTALPSPDEWDALFVGGTTGFKLSETAYRLVREAKEAGKWTHMGRVNSLRRLRAAAMGGYDSADGTHLAFRPDRYAAAVAGWMDDLRGRPALPLW